MNTKPDALKLASVPIFDRSIGWQADATATLKEQAAEIAELKEAYARLRQVHADYRRECGDTDAILRVLGLDPVNCRTDGGSLKLAMISGALEHRDFMLKREAAQAAAVSERHACSIAVWMALQDALEPGADDKGLDGWIREAEARVKNRPAHHRAEAPLPQAFCWLVEEFGPDGSSTGHYMLDQGALTITTDVHAAKKLRRWQSAGLRALDMKAQHKGDWRAVEHGFGA